jgi:hypothetical protein
VNVIAVGFYIPTQCKRGPEFRMYCCEENKVDLFAYLEIRKDAVINGALTAVLGSMIEGDQWRPTWEEILTDLTREVCIILPCLATIALGVKSNNTDFNPFFM